MTLPTTLPVDAVRAQRRVVGVLVGTQVFGGVGVVAAVAVSALVATELSGSELLGGLAQTAIVLGAVLLALPIARLTGRRGRRPALLLGYGSATLGATVAAVAVLLGSAGLLLGGLLLLGGGTAAGLAARFAATDLARPDRRARALSAVVWATTVGAVAGPNLAAPAEHAAAALGLTPAAGPYCSARRRSGWPRSARSAACVPTRCW